MSHALWHNIIYYTPFLPGHSEWSALSVKYLICQILQKSDTQLCHTVEPSLAGRRPDFSSLHTSNSSCSSTSLWLDSKLDTANWKVSPSALSFYQHAPCTPDYHLVLRLFSVWAQLYENGKRLKTGSVYDWSCPFRGPVLLIVNIFIEFHLSDTIRTPPYENTVIRVNRTKYWSCRTVMIRGWQDQLRIMWPL